MAHSYCSKVHTLHFSEMAFNITSFNVKGLNSPHKRQMAWKEAIRLKTDIIGFQETHCISHNPPNFATTNSHVCMCIWRTVPKRKEELQLLSKTLFHSLKLPRRIRQIYHSCEIAKITSWYLPNTNQLRFLKKIWKRVASLKQGHVILCRDFKCNPR